jgi:hypothetical protein
VAWDGYSLITCNNQIRELLNGSGYKAGIASGVGTSAKPAAPSQHQHKKQENSAKNMEDSEQNYEGRWKTLGNHGRGSVTQSALLKQQNS